MKIRLLAAALLAGTLFGQTAFEAVSIRPTDPATPGTLVRGGPGSPDPGYVSMRNIDLFSLVGMAYDVRSFQISAPTWLIMTRFDISMRVPPGVNADRYRAMLQGMLADRFHLALHHERKEMGVYDLVVAKGGPKLKEVPAPSTEASGLQPPTLRPTPPAGYHGLVMIRNGALSMEGLSTFLSGFLGAPVYDRTGLNGRYEIQFSAAVAANPLETAAENTPMNLLDVMSEHLGLRLVLKKDTVDLLVIDRMEKSPSGN